MKYMTSPTDDTAEMNNGMARAELHYVEFGDAETFEGLLERNGLSYTTATEYTMEISPTIEQKTGWHVWCGADGLHLLTTCNPLDGEHLDEGTGHRDEGYASYTQVIGPEDTAEELYRDVLETAVGVKGEFVPLTAANGEVLVDMESVLGTTRYNM